MLKINWIFVYLICINAAAPHNSNKKINITIEKIDFDYDINYSADAFNSDNDGLDYRQTFNDESINLRTKDNDKKRGTFFDFIKKAIQILSKYTDSELEYFFLVFNDEIRNYHYRGCKFNELTENIKINTFIDRNLLLIKNKPAFALRRYLKAMHKEIEEAKLSLNKRVFIDLINGFYGHDAVHKFDIILTNIDNYRMRATNKIDLENIVRAGIRSILFDYYTELSPEIRTKVKTEINEYLEYYYYWFVPEMNTNNTTQDKQNDVTTKKYIKKAAMRTNKRNKKNSDVNEDDNDEPITKISTREVTQKISIKYHKTSAKKMIERNNETTKLIKNKSELNRMVEGKLDVNVYEHFSNLNEERNNELNEKQEERKKWLYENNLTKKIEGSNQHLEADATEVDNEQYGRSASHVYKYEIHLNSDKNNVMEPKLYLKKPEFQIKFPDLYLGKEMVHISRQNEQSMIESPTFKHKNLVNVRSIFDAMSTVKKVNRLIENVHAGHLHRLRKVNKNKYSLQSQRTYPTITPNADISLPIQLKNDVKIIRELKNTNIKTSTGYEAKTPTPLLSITRPERRAYDFKKKIDVIKELISVQFNKLKDVISQNKNEQADTVPVTNKTVINEDLTRSRIQSENLLRKLKDHYYPNRNVMRNLELQRTGPEITSVFNKDNTKKNVYNTSVGQINSVQHNDVETMFNSDIQPFINLNKYLPVRKK